LKSDPDRATFGSIAMDDQVDGASPATSEPLSLEDRLTKLFLYFLFVGLPLIILIGTPWQLLHDHTELPDVVALAISIPIGLGLALAIYWGLVTGSLTWEDGDAGGD
jgi:hypothetical protein